MACGRDSAARSSCLELSQGISPTFMHKKFCGAGWFAAGEGYLGGREFRQACLQTQRGTGVRKIHIPSWSLSLRQGMTTNVATAALYLGLLVHKTKVIIPVLPRAGFLSGGTKGEVGSPRHLHLCSVILRRLPRALTLCLQWCDHSIPQRCSDFFFIPSFLCPLEAAVP